MITLSVMILVTLVLMKSLDQDIYQRNNDDIDYNEYSLLNVLNETVLGNEVTLCQ